ncbi:hypothetical protein GLIP_0822 [Aliiglaciecola lipolytica E3]|uniref:Uncharacterized protein n=1 Tax=Aliiglaciecola lipolytica E3 TaxID=1127673 RepID=K6Y5E9_9ALTE|nr:hypothetical protein GLIP_0822 [Aliiglaciecola lipolytica E3]
MVRTSINVFQNIIDKPSSDAKGLCLLFAKPYPPIMKLLLQIQT